MTRERWISVRNQGTTVADWIPTEAPPNRATTTPAEYRAIQNADLRFLTRSSRQYINETQSISTADRLHFEKSTGQGV
ncbi:hypothetical protein E0H73_43430 [Kribbella pittospori]|uniref:Uncharacterized protein n=2 Tax=Kribbella pittospori TaxID=722689 RepID=A0A4R0JQS5_9ACTN|nr:hypothetical protein E0H73_43430 [Kribbella pittospori]